MKGEGLNRSYYDMSIGTSDSLDGTHTQPKSPVGFLASSISEDSFGD